jgi:uncharacterized protein (DUF885 family)
MMYRTIVSLAAACALAACDREPVPPTEPAAATRAATPSAAAPSGAHDAWDRHVDGLIAEYYEMNPTAAINAGLHEYDGRLPDLGAAALEARRAWLRDERTAIADWDTAALDEERRFEREYLLSAIDRMRFLYDVSEFLHTNPTLYGFMIGPDVYLTRNYAPLPQRLRAFIAYERALPAFLDTMRANLRPPLARPRVEVAKASFDGYVTFFKDTVPGIFASVEDAALQAELADANAQAVAAFAGMRDWLAAQLETATDDYALGAERFLEMLRMNEGVEIGLAELKAAGERDLQRNLDALEAACGEYAPGATLAACAEKMQASKPPEGPVAGARRQLPELKAFLIAHDVVTIPSEEEALVDEAPPYRRSNAAYIQIPGPHEENLPSIYYIAPPDPAWSEEDQLAYIPAEKDLLFISAHEVWPGHFLQNLHSNGTKLGNVFGAYTFSEGWAHYCEEMMWELGLGDGDAEAHIGQLLNALLRNVRFLSAIGLHTEGMSVDESVAMFRERAFQDPGNALQQARRGTFDPGYLNYTLGKLMIMKLRADWMAQHGEGASLRAFHDTLLGYGEPPIPLARRYMLGAAYAGDTRLLP